MVYEDMAGFQTPLASEADAYLLWCDSMPRPDVHGMEALISAFCMEKIAALPDGAVYRFVSAKDRLFGDSRVFSDCLINGLWCCTFTSENLGPAGVVTDWVLRQDGTTESVWELHLDDGSVIRWHPSCEYVLTGHEFEFTSRGQATQSGTGATSPYVMSVRGKVDGETAAGTYTVSFSEPQWPAEDRGSWRVDRAHPVYRFWASEKGRHFYTIDQQEMTKLVNRHWQTWTPEHAVFYAYPEGGRPPETCPVYRFYAPGLDAHFFTMSQQEKEQLVRSNAETWTYEGVAFYAYSPDRHPPNAVPVHRLWSEAENVHFYTASQSERVRLTQGVARPWVYEGVAWYAIPDVRVDSVN